jgi:hypothetical protein
VVHGVLKRCQLNRNKTDKSTRINHNQPLFTTLYPFFKPSTSDFHSKNIGLNCKKNQILCVSNA